MNCFVILQSTDKWPVLPFRHEDSCGTITRSRKARRATVNMAVTQYKVRKGCLTDWPEFPCWWIHVVLRETHSGHLFCTYIKAVPFVLSASIKVWGGVVVAVRRDADRTARRACLHRSLQYSLTRWLSAFISRLDSLKWQETCCETAEMRCGEGPRPASNRGVCRRRRVMCVWDCSATGGRPGCHTWLAIR